MTWIGLALVLLLPARPNGAEQGAEPGAEVEALSDPSREVREQAIADLAGSDRGIDDLLLLLHEKDARIRRGVCAALARRGEPAAIPALLVEGSPEAAEACVRIVETIRVDLPMIATLATPRMRALLVEAHGAAVHARLARLGGSLQLSRPQIHRANFAGGIWSERLLVSIARDADQPPGKRAHALHVAQLMMGRALHVDLVNLLDDPQDEVRSAALVLLWRLHTTNGNRVLAKLLDRGNRYRSDQVSLLVSSVDQGGKPGPKGIEFLASRIAKASPSIAASAAAVLMNYDRERALRLLTARVRDEIHRSDGPQVALFFLRCGTPTDELRELASKTKDPLARLAALGSAAEVKTAIRDHLDPRHGSTEWFRVRVVSTLLVRHEARWEDRIRYARGVLKSDLAAWRAGGLAVLRGAPKVMLLPLHPLLKSLLRDPTESVRVKAAILLLPDVAAQRVLWAAIYDGDPRTAWTAAPVMDASLSRNTPVAERRRRARDALAALDRR